MLEDKRKIHVPGWAKRTMKGNGSGGVEGFIQANSELKSRSMPKRWTSHLRDYKKGKAITWNGKVINPTKLDISRLTTQKITNLDTNKSQ